MVETVYAIGLTLEEKVFEDVKKSSYFSLIIVEATDISVTKLFGLCFQYLVPDAQIQTRN